MLRPHEWLYYRPGFNGCSLLTLATVPVANATEWGVLTLSMVPLMGLFIAWVEGEDRTLKARKQRILDSRLTRYHKRRVIATPEGSFVRVELLERVGFFETARPDGYHRFHAEDEAEEAHACAARLRSPEARPGSVPTTEAKALAKVLSAR